MGETAYRIGCTGYRAERTRYQQALNFVEMSETRRGLPKASTIDIWRAGAAPGFRFGLLAPDLLCEPGAMRPTRENVELLDRTFAAAARLGAVLRMHTTPALGPGPEALEAFGALLAAVDRRGVRVVWEPRGVLKDFEAIAWSERLGVVPVLDPFQDRPAPGPVAYVRIHPFMTMSDGLDPHRIAALAEMTSRYEEAYVVFDTPAAWRDACAMRRLVEPHARAADAGDAADPAETGAAD